MKNKIKLHSILLILVLGLLSACDQENCATKQQLFTHFQ